MKKISLLLALVSTFSIAGQETVNTADINQALNYYCATEHSEFQEQVVVGEGEQILFHQGPFMQVSARLDSESIKSALSEEFKNTTIDTQCSEYLLTYAEVQDEKVNQKYLARVLFNFDKYSLTERSKYILNQISQQIDQQDDVILLDGNTDNIGKKSYNMALGLARSESVKAYLVELGVDEALLEVGSSGEANAIENNDTVSGRHHNRRVDITNVDGSEE
ncbi:OmpA family protein [Aliivibrio sp. S4TY2]|uniref:OmpA family protein n=1 Tax=unclassified Aliivibrio TaxID=2645654 RepID=UPI0023781221|nr:MULTISPECIES: OmpA family protein [unclassified Aliivibrio]MDD9157950.1 OmpA family protein [Aliivibrio sp. S4TY2]MDD9162229.1 OmpA family protein [Aliivibrio sp. S4TY1]MDD9166267.1 OmpA family protein [Aliivibrio sp. S4MY2]MDD9170260.1 OmpA family protein [Aliivibrio sp. S4MY4]MDD9187311.1 OmpA family protein [Aliivibrio sp. S4MY3]